MNFFENFCHQCDLKGVKPSRALEDAGLSKSLYQKWRAKPERMPYGDTVKKLCDYFGCSYDALDSSAVVTDKTDTYTLLNQCILALPKRDREHLLSYILFTYREDLPDEMQKLRTFY